MDKFTEKVVPRYLARNIETIEIINLFKALAWITDRYNLLTLRGTWIKFKNKRFQPSTCGIKFGRQ